MRKIALLSIVVILFLGACAQSKQNKPVRVLIETEYGNMTAVLYNDTPLHRDNFLKLTKQGWYNSSFFHRVINNFMIQGGGKDDNVTDPGYTVPAEFLPVHFHKKGSLAAARKPDQVNPDKVSSGSQFYIVQGQVLNDQQLDMFEKQFGKTMSPERREAYKTLGGTPHLDDAYTVFGEIESGLEVIDAIASVQTGPGDRPLKEVKMKISVLK